LTAGKLSCRTDERLPLGLGSLYILVIHCGPCPIQFWVGLPYFPRALLTKALDLDNVRQEANVIRRDLVRQGEMNHEGGTGDEPVRLRIANLIEEEDSLLFIPCGYCGKVALRLPAKV
jgi:hypothetical protein